MVLLVNFQDTENEGVISFLTLKIATKIKKHDQKDNFQAIFPSFMGLENLVNCGKYRKFLKFSANGLLQVFFLQCKISDSSIPSQVMKIY